MAIYDDDNIVQDDEVPEEEVAEKRQRSSIPGWLMVLVLVLFVLFICALTFPAISPAFWDFAGFLLLV